MRDGEPAAREVGLQQALDRDRGAEVGRSALKGLAGTFEAAAATHGDRLQSRKIKPSAPIFGARTRVQHRDLGKIQRTALEPSRRRNRHGDDRHQGPDHETGLRSECGDCNNGIETGRQQIEGVGARMYVDFERRQARSQVIQTRQQGP
jgi:hypothetical protein